MSQPEDERGDSACWLDAVCEDCGALMDGPNAHRPGCSLAPAPPGEGAQAPK